MTKNWTKTTPSGCNPTPPPPPWHLKIEYSLGNRVQVKLKTCKVLLKFKQSSATIAISWKTSISSSTFNFTIVVKYVFKTAGRCTWTPLVIKHQRLGIEYHVLLLLDCAHVFWSLLCEHTRSPLFRLRARMSRFMMENQFKFKLVFFHPSQI